MTLRWSVALYAVPIILLIGLAIALGPTPLFSGDSGLKLLQARSFAGAHGLPWVIRPPVLGPAPSPGMQSTLLLRQDGHWVSIFPFDFALIIAPFVWMFGDRAALAIPLLAGIAAAVLVERLAWKLGGSLPPGVLFAAALIATPLGFYSVTIWEHSLGIALALGALAIMIGSRDAPAWLGAGALLAAAAWTRAELHALLPLLFLPPLLWGDWRSSRRTFLAGVSGFASTYVLFVCVQHLLLGLWVPVHLGHHPERDALAGTLLATRLRTLDGLLFPDRYRGAATCVVLLGTIAAFRWRTSLPRRAVSIALAATLASATLVIAPGLWAVRTGHSLSTSFPFASAVFGWSVLWPVPWLVATGRRSDRGARSERITLWTAIALCGAATLLAVPGALGFEWAARGFFFCLLIGVALAGATMPVRDGILGGRSALVACFVAGLATQAVGIAFMFHVVKGNRELRDLLLSEAGSRPIITDTRFVPDLLAPEWDRQPVLLVRSRDDVIAALSLAAEGSSEAVLAASVQQETFGALRLAPGERFNAGTVCWVAAKTSTARRTNRDIDLTWLERCRE